jgi:hypothetical protein
MELTSRESVLIAFALNVLAIDGSSIINAESTELRDLAQKVIASASKN